MASIVGSTDFSEKPPPASRGVFTMMNVASDARTAASVSVVADSLPLDSVINSCNPGSCTGALPALIASTFFASRSTDVTRNPFAAKHADIGEPNFPSPITEIAFTMCPLIEFLSPTAIAPQPLRLRRQTQMPTQPLLEPAKHRLRHPPEIPLPDILIFHIVRNPVRKNMLHFH